MHRLTPPQEATAWFMLANYIARDQQVYALAMYRLLAQTFNDDLLAQHLYADILYSLHMDEDATKAYHELDQY